MAYPITRQFGPNAKGSELTFADMDNNLLYLDSKVTGSNGYIALFSGSSDVRLSSLYQDPQTRFIIGGTVAANNARLTINASHGGLSILLSEDPNALVVYNGASETTPFRVGTDGDGVWISAPTELTGSLNVLGVTTLTGSLTISGSTTITGSLRITGSVTSSNGILVNDGGITSTGNSYFRLPDFDDAFVLYSEFNLVNQLRIDAYNSITYLQEVDGEVNIGSSTPQGYKLSVNGTTLLSGSVTITDVLTLPPVNPLPSGRPTGSLAVSGSGANCRIYFFNGSWNALF